MNKIKDLPRNDQGILLSEFKANGKRFIIRSPEEAVGIYRFGQMEKMGGALGMGTSFKQLVKAIKQNEDIAFEDIPAALKVKKMLMNNSAILEGIKSTAKDRYSMAFIMCTLFIVRPEEDLTNWNKDYANAKIDDWNKEGLNEQDFLELALTITPGFISAYKQRNQSLKDLQQKRRDLEKTLKDLEPSV